MRLFALLITIALVGSLAAQQDPFPPKKLTISAAAAPRPALKYSLLPEARDRTSGNAALGYFRTFAARPSAPNREAAQAAEAAMVKWEETPVAELPTADVRKQIDMYITMFRELDKAVVSDRCDWEMGPRIKADGIGVLLNEVQPSREVTRYLAVRTRLELAENNFDGAAKSLRSGMQFSKHVGEGPTMIQLLVGLALEGVMLERIEEWIARPGSPNLYWALTSLPQPLIDPKPAFDGESLFTETIFPGIRELERDRLTADRANRIGDDLFLRALGTTRDPDKPNPEFEATLRKLGLAGYVALHLPTAKTELIARGRSAKDVEAMSPTQAVFLNSLERYQELRDEQWKWFGQPYYQAHPALTAVEERRKRMVKDLANDPVFTLFALLIPAGDKVYFATVRNDRKVAVLRTFEAIRLHLATTGKLPAKLEDISAVPVPIDPVTGKLFGYTPTGESFTLTGPPPAGEAANPSNYLNYDVTVRRGK